MRFFKVVLASALGYILAALIMMFLVIALVVGLASNAKPKIEIKNQSVLNIKLNFPLRDRTYENDPFAVLSAFDSEFESPIGLNDVL
jgi:protease-4